MVTRRRFVLGALSTGAWACSRSAQVRSRQPRITHGVQSGDVQTGRALIWARCDEPARMVVEWDTTERFARPRRIAGPVVGPASDGAATVAIDGLPDAQTICYRVRFEREAARGASAWAAGRFATPRADRIRFAWTGDTCGQGFGRNPEWGGLRGYRAIRDAEPAFFLHSGDMIYADHPILAAQPLDDGRIWRNISNERVARVAEALGDFRARFAYNLEDDHVQALARDVPIIAQWDDHETHNNWWPGQVLDDDRYRTERRASVLSARARQAMIEWTPVPPGPVHRVLHYGPLLDVIVLDCRSFRTANDANRGATGAMLGAAQAAWFVEAAAASRARWKIIACDQPIGLVIGDGPDNSRNEGFANGDGPPLGRERELAGILAALRERGVQNLAWLTADVHYAAAHHYDPARATGAVFDPFWEFVAGPIHAGTFSPNTPDPTFGIDVKFQWAPAPGHSNLAPWDGLQSFGTIDVTGDALTVALRGIDGRERYRVELSHM
ncbi:MAG: alkaline phosphatase [Deltaproteobacteria bacterium]|nr:MAG: alkaline phosphatase [Deltaproteobacteria bacterium]TMQ22992.1 MAG: alkaline phosphatase [Deltaproteobacteria bacterium]